MTVFAAVRHPDIDTLGVCPQGALEYQRGLGWFRVSPWFPEPADIHLPNFADAFEDLDAEPAPKKSRPVKPVVDEEQEA